ncbi:MAG: HIT family hydrolase [Aquifex sp.]|nr:MAG: HIT family hydrolase [Aquifex sp.]
MNILWAPWRLKYIEKFNEKSEANEENECVFCKIAQEKNDDANFVVTRSEHTFVVLNIFPYNTGHVMVVPYKHVPTIEDLTMDELKDLMRMTKLIVKALKKAYSPHGFNLGANIGRDAGAGIEEHFHLHVLPRWRGDTNFMPTISNTKVIPEDLGTTLNKIRKALNEILRDERALDL